MLSVQSLIKMADFLIIAQARATRTLDIEIDPGNERSVATVLLAILCIQHGRSPENLITTISTSEICDFRGLILQASEKQ